MNDNPSAPPSRFGLLSTIHHCVLDPDFFTALREYRFSKSVGYLLILVLICSIISGIAHTVYFTDPQKGFAPKAAAAFKDLRLENGRLIPLRQTPYVPDPSAIRDLLVLGVGMPELMDIFPDSLIIIDTAATAGNRRKPGVLAVFTATSLVLYPTISLPMNVPYGAFFGGADGSLFDPQNIMEKMRRHRVSIAIQFVIQDGFLCLLNTLLSVVFLMFAAFILTFRVEHRWRYSIVASIYASTPVVLGSTIVSLSGTHVRGTWYFFMIAASIVLFRGIRRAIPPQPAPPAAPM